jgi:glutamate racemase
MFAAGDPIESAGSTTKLIFINAFARHDHALDWKNSSVLLFNTPATITSQVYANALLTLGITKDAVVNQPCPGLVNLISNNAGTDSVAIEIGHWVALVLKQIPQTDSPLAIILGCTHYGYHRVLFEEAIARDYKGSFFIVIPND